MTRLNLTGPGATDLELVTDTTVNNMRPNGPNGIFYGLELNIICDTIINALGLNRIVGNSTYLITNNGAPAIPDQVLGSVVSIEHYDTQTINELWSNSSFVYNFGPGLINKAYGLYVDVADFGGGINEAYRVYIENDFGTPATVQNHGLFIGNQTGRAITTNVGLVSFGDDTEYRDTSDGPVLIDRATGLRRRIICTNGILSTEAA